MARLHSLDHFKRLLEQPDDQINLAEAALVIAADEYPDLDIARYLGHLDALAASGRTRVDAVSTPREKIAALNQFLFHDSHFGGNREFYYDPRNSYLNDVLTRRVGLPITLSLVYIEVGRRLGLPLYGVGLPGHFVVKWRDEREEIFVDPFNDGEILNEAGLTHLIENIHSQRMPLQRDWLDAVGPRYILVRILTNLKGLYLTVHDYERALPVAEKLLLLEPQSEDHLHDAALLSFRAGLYQRAADLLEEFLLKYPNGSESFHARIYLRSAWVAIDKSN